MGRKIIGQCNTCDFEHLAAVVKNGETIDVPNLPRRQQVAVQVIRHFQLCGISPKVLFKLREVLVWEMPDKGIAFEYKLLSLEDRETADILNSMAPRKVKNGRS